MKINSSKKRFAIIFLLYVLGIFESKFLDLYRNSQGLPAFLCFPWDFDVVLVSITYFSIGYYWNDLEVFWKKRNRKSIGVIISLGTIIFYAMLNIFKVFDFSIDMKHSDYSSLIFTLIVPVCFFNLFQQLTAIIMKNSWISYILEKVGYMSLVIMYTHIAIRELIVKQFWGENYSIVVYIVSVIGLSWMITKLINSNVITRYLFMGRK